ncbi:MAG: hypothetical protein J0M34_04770 [Alphaproteobacteria bacterium]|nr:hypothetical protein [Alphaproteobacteria bacterium]
MKNLIALTAVMLCLTACGNQQNTAMLDQNKANWDELAVAPEAATVKNGFLIMMR